MNKWMLEEQESEETLSEAVPGPPPPRAFFGDNALLANIPADALESICRRIEVMHYSPGEVIFGEHQPGEALYLIAAGSVKISKQGRGGEQETLIYLRERDFFGEMALIDRANRSAQASAEGPAVLGRVNYDTWRMLIQLAPREVFSNFTRSITGRLRYNNEHFIEEIRRHERLSMIGSTVSTIVHDMNNPITAILGACELMQTTAQNPLTDRMTRMIRGAVGRMEAMTRELLDFSRGNLRIETQAITAAELLGGLEGDIEQYRRTRIQVDVEILYPGEIFVDRNRMLRVLANLMNNARDAMAGPPSGTARRIGVRVSQENKEIVFEVSDSGSGIPAHLLPGIFDPFVTHGKANGTGLGLAVAKAVVAAHHGTISVKSEVGVGTTFRIALPVA